MKKSIFLLFILFSCSDLTSQSINYMDRIETTFYDNGNIYTQKIVNPKNNNEKMIIYFEDGVTKLGEWECTADGTYIMGKSYYKNGKISHQDYYDNGKIIETKCWNQYGNLIDCKSENGPFKEYYNSGNLKMEGIHSDGEFNGLTVMYHENGNVMGEVLYRNGVSIGTKKYYYEDGTLQLESNDNGKYLLMYPNGNIEKEGQLKNGKNYGKWKYYYENGNIQYSGYWKDDKEDGVWKVFDESGRLLNKVIMKDGEVIE